MNEKIVIEDLDAKDKAMDKRLKLTEPEMRQFNLPDELMQFIRQMTKKHVEDEWLSDNKEEWGKVARVMDRLFLILLLLAIFIMSCVMIGQFSFNRSLINQVWM